MYRDIPAIQEYELVDSSTLNVYTFRLNENNHWELEEYKRLEERLEIKTVKVSIPLAEIYEGIKLDQAK